MGTAQTLGCVRDKRARTFAFIALLLGGTALGLSPIFVRLSDVGPVASAFWRLTLALPFLWFWAFAKGDTGAAGSKPMVGVALLAGGFFAADLGVWHWSIVYTTVANATLLANYTPVFVTLAGWFLFRQRVSVLFMAGMITALAGTTLLVGPSFSGGKHLAGDGLALLAAVFYAGYMLSIKRARDGYSTAMLMALSGTVSALILLPFALLSPQAMLPSGAAGWTVLLALALVSQVLGQSLIAYAFAHLSAALSSVGVLTQPVVAAALAWILFGESLNWPQLLGGALVLLGIFVARKTD